MVASISLSGSATGPVGTVVTVTGLGYTPSSTITVFTFNTAPAVLTPAIPATAVGTGNWTATFVVPETDQAASPVTVSATDAATINATTTYTVTTSLKVVPISGSEDDTVTANGHSYTATDALTAITIGGVTPLAETVTAQTVAANGTWTGTFVVPVLTTGPQTVTATTAADTASATFTVSGQSIGPDESGPVHGTATNAQTVTATLTTTSNPDLIVAVVAWQDTGNATVVVTDAIPLVWSPRGPIRAYGDFKIQEWTAPSSATITAKLVTATFSTPKPTGKEAISVVGFTTVSSNYGFDSNLGLPGAVNSGGTFAAVTSSITTHLAPELLFGALVLVPQATITEGTGWTQIDAVNATAFELQTEYKLANTIQDDTVISWTMTSAAQTAVGVTDAFLGLGATAFPWTAKDIGAQVTSNGASEQGVAYWFYPQISTSGDVVTFDRSIGDINSLQPLTGTTTSATNLVLTDTTLALTVNALAGAILTYVSGTAKGESRVIASNTATTITTSPAFLPIPTALGGDSYRVTSPEFYQVEQHLASNNPVVGQTDGATNTWATYSPV